MSKKPIDFKNFSLKHNLDSTNLSIYREEVKIRVFSHLFTSSGLNSCDL